MGKIIDNQLDLEDGLKHLSMVEIIKDYSDKINDFKFHVGSGFFFVDSFGELYKALNVKKLNLGSDEYIEEWNTPAPILIMMGKQTNKNTKEALIDAENIVKHSLNSNDIEYMQFLEELIRKDLIKFKVFTDKRFHAKIYFFYENDSIADVYVGSSNLTLHGLTKNIELTSPINGTFDVRNSHKEWFLNLWKKSTDDLNVLEIIQSYKANDFIYYEPRAFFENLIKIMDKEYLFYNSDISENTLLVKFQSFDFYQVMNRLNKYNGCILSSSVGLGKSYVALEVMRYYKNREMKVLLIGPSNLVKGSIWHDYFDKYDLIIETIGFGDLQQSNFNTDPYKHYDLIVVDEAHNLRNTSNRRNNMKKIMRNSFNAKFLFLTATPINTKISDLNSLIDLFYEVHKSSWLNKKLKTEYEKFKLKVNKFESLSADNDSDKLFKEIQELQKYVEQELIVKTTRKMIKKYFADDLLLLSGTTELLEPKVNKVVYSYPQEYIDEFFKILPSFLINLSYEYAKFKNDGENFTYKEDLNLIAFYRWLLYKRSESSIYAFYKSLKTLKNKTELYLKFLENKILDEKLVKNVHDREIKKKLIKTKKVYDENDIEFKNRIIFSLKNDIDYIDEMTSKLDNLRIGHRFKDDSKLELLKKLLIENQEKKCLIFTEYFDTLEYVYKNLKDAGINVGYVAGRDLKGISLKHSTKDENIKKFKNNQYQHLIATEVISEGFNISEADIVINYDLPYNPVRLIQRVGRATRINVLKQIEIMNFHPDSDVDGELNLINILNLRISNIISMIGIDYNIWSYTEKILKKREKLDEINKYEVIKELKNRIAEENPEDIYQISLRKESKLDILIKKSIDYYNINPDDIPINKPNKPIYTSLISDNHDFYGIYQFEDDFYEYGTSEENIRIPLKPQKSYSKENVISFTDKIKKKYLEIQYLREDQSLTSHKDRVSHNQINNIKNGVIPLKSTMNKLLELGPTCYTNYKIQEKVNEIFNTVKDKISNGKILLCCKDDERKVIRKWKSDFEEIMNEFGFEKVPILNEWAKNPDSYKQNILAFIQYQKEDH
ncbi:MAG: phospholipase D-like domain-containing protein [Methanobrevibacter sp.]|jgi:ERCC4-related helicase|nr:phospholipase D-like domain-containing protein [Candidatus Methanovirga meridionalis]